MLEGRDEAVDAGNVSSMHEVLAAHRHDELVVFLRPYTVNDLVQVPEVAPERQDDVESTGVIVVARLGGPPA